MSDGPYGFFMTQEEFDRKWGYESDADKASSRYLLKRSIWLAQNLFIWVLAFFGALSLLGVAYSYFDQDGTFEESAFTIVTGLHFFFTTIGFVAALVFLWRLMAFGVGYLRLRRAEVESLRRRLKEARKGPAKGDLSRDADGFPISARRLPAGDRRRDGLRFDKSARFGVREREFEKITSRHRKVKFVEDVKTLLLGLLAIFGGYAMLVVARLYFGWSSAARETETGWLAYLDLENDDGTLAAAADAIQDLRLSYTVLTALAVIVLLWMLLTFAVEYRALRHEDVMEMYIESVQAENEWRAAAEGADQRH